MSSRPAPCAQPAVSPGCGAPRSCSPGCAAETSGGTCRSCSAFDACQGGCMAAKFFTGLPLDGPDPECVKGHGATALSALDGGGLPRAGRPFPPRPGRISGHAVDRVPAKPCAQVRWRSWRERDADRAHRPRAAPAPCRVMFGPHETNLGRRRAISARHVAYYARRAAGGSGVIVTETASVHPSDWPYERAPLAADCGRGWAETAAACRPHGALVLAGLGHAGMQGSSAYSQAALWAPSRVPDAGSREVPMEMTDAEIDAVVDGFAGAAALAAESGLDGVEINAGQHSLLRQFLSGLTNQRGDGYGEDRLLLAERVLRRRARRARRRAGARAAAVLRRAGALGRPHPGTRGRTGRAARRAGGLPRGGARLDLLGLRPPGPTCTPSPASTSSCAGDPRGDRHGPGGAAGHRRRPRPGAVGAQDGVTADLVEMTRAQIADPDLVARCRAGEADGPPLHAVQPDLPGARPPQPARHLRRRARAAATSSSTTTPQAPDQTQSTVLVVGGGPAGLEAARVLALRGHRVRLVERGPAWAACWWRRPWSGRQRLARGGGLVAAGMPAAGVAVSLGHEVTAADVDDALAEGVRVVLATGSVPGPRDYHIAPGAGVRGGRRPARPGEHR